MSGSEITIPLTYYGRYLFALSPTYSRWVRLTSKDIHTSLHHRAGFEGQNIWFYLNHPIRWIRIVGVVVAYDDLENRCILILDDGSGHQIELISWKTPQSGTNSQKFTPADLTGVKLHSVVKAKGNVNEFWGRRQVVLKRITVLKNTNDEVAAWAETTKFKSDILCKPWFVSDEIMAEEKRKLTMNPEDEKRRREKKLRKLEREKRERRKEEGKKGKAMGKENMLSDSLVEKLHGEGQTRAKRKTREGSEVLSPERKKPSISVKPVTTSGISYRGRRRQPGQKPPLPLPTPPSLLPQSLIPHLPPEPPREYREVLPTTTSGFRGRRRATPAPISNPTPEQFLTPEPTLDIPLDSSHQLPPLPESTCHGHHQDHQAEKPQDYSGVETDTLNTVTTSNLNPGGKPTHRGRRWISKSLADTPESQTLELSLKPRLSESSNPSVGTSSYRGRRRTSKLLADTLTPNTSLSTPAPPQHPTQTSHRERWKIMKAQREAEAQSVMLSSLPMDNTLSQPGVCDSTYLERKRARKEMAPRAPEVAEQELVKRPTYRGKRRGEKPPVDTIGSEPSHVPTFMSSTGSQLSRVESSSYRGRRRTEEPLTYSFELPTSMSSFAPTPPLEETSSYRGRRRSEKPQSS